MMIDDSWDDDYNDRNHSRRRGNFLSSGLGLLLVAMLAVLLWGAYSLYDQNKDCLKAPLGCIFPTPTPAVTIYDVFAILSSEEELVTYKRETGLIVRVTNHRPLAPDPVLTYYAYTIVQAGFDLRQLLPEDIEIRDDVVIIHLPSPVILESYVDVRRSESIDEDWLPYPDMVTEAQTKATTQARTDACAAEILDLANNHAQELLESLLQAVAVREVRVVTSAGNC